MLVNIYKGTKGTQRDDQKAIAENHAEHCRELRYFPAKPSTAGPKALLARFLAENQAHLCCESIVGTMNERNLLQAVFHSDVKKNADNS